MKLQRILLFMLMLVLANATAKVFAETLTSHQEDYAPGNTATLQLSETCEHCELPTNFALTQFGQNRSQNGQHIIGKVQKKAEFQISLHGTDLV